MGYGIVAEVGEVLVRLLSENMVPDVILSPNNIGLCSPEEHGDLNLGIFLFDIEESEEVVTQGMVNTGLRRQAYPSVFLDLYYMVTAYSDSDLKFRAREEQKILGKVIQVFRDYSVLSEQMLGEGVSLPARIELQKLGQYEKNQMWNFSGIPYKVSLFYRVGPVEITSAKVKEIARVTDVSFAVREQNK